MIDNNKNGLIQSLKHILKTEWIFVFLALLINLIVLIIALTNSNPDNPFNDYRLILGISFITIGSVL